jgi:hypothetical protein
LQLERTLGIHMVRMRNDEIPESTQAPKRTAVERMESASKIGGVAANRMSRMPGEILQTQMAD